MNRSKEDQILSLLQLRFDGQLSVTPRRSPSPLDYSKVSSVEINIEPNV